MDSYDFNIKAFFGLLRRQLRLILLTVVTVVAISAVIIFSLTPTFTASALILVDPSRKNLLEPDSQVVSGSADSARIDSEVEILRSDNVLQRVIQSMDLIKDPEFGVTLSMRNQLLSFLRMAEPQVATGEQAVNQTLTKLRNAISVQRRAATYLIALQVHSESPTKAAELANALADAYIKDQVTSKVSGALASRDILQTRIVEARQAILASEGSFDDFIRTNMDTIVRDTGRTDLANMQTQLDTLSSQRTSSAQLADEVQASIDAGNFQSITQSLQSDALAELERQRADLTNSMSAASADSPTAVDLRTKLADIETRLRQQATSEVGALRTTVAQTQTAEDTLRQTLRTDVLGSSLTANTLTQLYELQQNAQLARAQYQTLLSRSQDLEAQASLQVADSRIVSPALTPYGASFPNTPLLLVVMLIVASGLGLGLAFLYENVLGGFTDEAQLESVLKARVASAIPKVKAKGGENTPLSSLMVSTPLSVFAESVRRVRAAADLLLRQRVSAGTAKAPVIMVTSTAPAEGKTTVALSLARSYALSGRRTLLIDCDLRKPSVHRQLGLEPSHGLLDFLSQDGESSDISAILTRDADTGTTVVLGARRSGLPTDQLIASPAFQRLISAAQQTFDVVVIDTPPIGPVVDGLYIAPFADIIIYVVRWSATQQSDVRAAVRLLESAVPETTPILTVLNQQDGSRAGYRNKYGEYYAEYS